jgi:predicted amidohydrolase
MHNIDLVLFPELYLTGGVSYSESDGDNVDANADDSQGDGNHAGVSAMHASLDRESYELSIIGNLCAELNVACAMGYAELKHESEIDASIVEVSSVYNSMALFHADGSRAANFRCTISDTDKYLNGNPFVEVMPVNLNLPCRGEESRNNDNQIKVGMAIGNEIFVPEHYRHLARSGAQLLLAASAFHSRCHSQDEHVSSANMEEKCVLTTRAMENGVPILSSNYVGVRGGGCEAGELLFNGSSGIVSSRGKDLVVAPQMEGGDMPCGEGYFLPCETGDLYAADVSYVHGSNNDRMRSSLSSWDLAPRGMGKITNDDTGISKREKDGSGFGKEVQQVVKGKRRKNRKVRK